MITRRKVLLGSLGGAALVVVGGLGTKQVSEAEIAAAVRRRLSFLKLDEEGPRAFARDKIDVLLAKRPSWQRIKTRIREKLAKPMERWGFSNDKRTSHQRWEDNLAIVYLLSSDFFHNGADVSRTVRYVALYDPMRACNNPFARLVTGAAPKA